MQSRGLSISNLNYCFNTGCIVYCRLTFFRVPKPKSSTKQRPRFVALSIAIVVSLFCFCILRSKHLSRWNLPLLFHFQFHQMEQLIKCFLYQIYTRVVFSISAPNLNRLAISSDIDLKFDSHASITCFVFVCVNDKNVI